MFWSKRARRCGSEAPTDRLVALQYIPNLDDVAVETVEFLIDVEFLRD